MPHPSFCFIPSFVYTNDGRRILNSLVLSFLWLTSTISLASSQILLLPAMMSSPHKLTATQVLELLKNNTLTVEAYARSLLDRIQARDGTVKAWAYLGKPTPCSSR